MEKDDEVKGSGNSLDFGARIYDPRIGRWLSIDGVKAPWQSGYIYTSNDPIRYSDPTGNWQTDGHYFTVLLIATMLGISDADDLAYYTEYPDTKIHGVYSEERYTWAIPYVQQETHALTGGNGPLLSFETTLNIMDANLTDKKELGRLLHKLGDTYAHRVLDGDGTLYGGWSIWPPSTPWFTTLHAVSDGSEPDLIKNRIDDGVWNGYTSNMIAVLASKYNKFDNSTVTKIQAKLTALGNYAKNNNVSLKGIMNYEVAVAKGENEFFINQPASYMNGTNQVPTAEHKQIVANTLTYMKSLGVNGKAIDYYEKVTPVAGGGSSYDSGTLVGDTQIFRGTKIVIE